MIDHQIRIDLQAFVTRIRREAMEQAARSIDNALAPLTNSDTLQIDSSALPLSDDDPQPVSMTADPGTSGNIARADHVHVGGGGDIATILGAIVCDSDEVVVEDDEVVWEL